MAAVTPKSPEIWRTVCLTDHYNSLGHAAFSVQEFLAAKNMAVPPPPTILNRSISPLLTSCLREQNRGYRGCLRNSGTITDRPTSDSRKSVPPALSAVAATLGLINKLWVGEWSTIMVNLNCVSESPREVSDAPRVHNSFLIILRNLFQNLPPIL